MHRTVKSRDKELTVFAGDAASFHEWQFRLQIKKSFMQGRRASCTDGRKSLMLYAVKLCHVPWRLDLAKLMEANGLDLLVQKVQERLFPQRTAEARELLKQGMRIGGPMSRVRGRTNDELHSRVVVVGGLSCTRWTTR